MKWFISDLHLGHEKVYQGRGFPTIEDHDNTIINNINLRVKPEDTLFILGDVCVAGPKKIEVLQRMREITCRKVLIAGNHDPGDMTILAPLFDAIHGAYVLGNEQWLLTHVPVHPQCLDGRFNANLHGHMHRTVIKSDPRYLNLSVERTGYLPVNLPTVKALLIGERMEQITLP